MGKWEGENGDTAAEPGASAPVRRFEDLSVWQTARELTRGVYRACQSQRLKTDRPLSDQMKRAAVSIGSNIAEGYERRSRKQHIEACYYAKGSAGELRSQLITARDVGLLEEEAYEWLMDRCVRCSRQLAAYIAHLQRSSARIPGLKAANARKSRE